MNRLAVTHWILGLSLEAVLVLTYASSPRPQTVAFVLALSLFPAFYLLAAFRLRQDGFALGSIYIAMLFVAAIYWGWSHSPQLEAPHLLWIASALPAVFVVVVVLFNYLQREG